MYFCGTRACRHTTHPEETNFDYKQKLLVTPMEMSRCNCPKLEVKENEARSPCFEEITTRMEERRCDLLGRQKYLRDKITTMERSIPALIAYNLWMTNKCDDPPYCKVREIMKRFCPYPDQTEALLKNLRKTVKELNGETAELHEKIIQADMKLEETDMELESLELINKEMSDTLNSLEREVNIHKSPSLHSINSEDLICLSKIRQLAAEELNLKNCIKELEQKEMVFKEHMDRLLKSKEYQNVCGRRKISCPQDVDCVPKICCMPKKCLMNSSNYHRSKKKQTQQDIAVGQSDAVVCTNTDRQEVQQDKTDEKIEKRCSWISNWWKTNNKVDKSPSETKSVTLSNAENNGKEKSDAASEQSNFEKETKEDKICNSQPSKQLKSKFSTPSCEPCAYIPCPPIKLPPCSHPCVRPRELQNMLQFSCLKKNTICNKYKPTRSGCCNLSNCGAKDHGIRRTCRSIVMPPCDFRNPCEIPPSFCKDLLRLRGNCRVNYRSKCARDLTEADCNCSDILNFLDECRPTGERRLDTLVQDSSSEDDFCECCSCGCEDSDESFSCPFN